MKTLFLVQIPHYEAIFDDSDELLGSWHENDACWRNEFYQELMQNLGYRVASKPASMEMKRKIKAKWGE